MSDPTPSPEAIAATLEIAKKTGAVNTWLDTYRTHVAQLLAALEAERVAHAEREQIWAHGIEGQQRKLAELQGTLDVAEAALEAKDGEVARLVESWRTRGAQLRELGGRREYSDPQGYGQEMAGSAYLNCAADLAAALAPSTPKEGDEGE